MGRISLHIEAESPGEFQQILQGLGDLANAGTAAAVQNTALTTEAAEPTKPTTRSRSTAKKVEKEVPESSESAETTAKDDKDEKAETKGKAKKLTHDDARQELNKYVKRYGLEAAQEDGPKVIGLVFKGKGYETIKECPDDQESLEALIAGFEELLTKNPFNREPEL